MNRRNFIGLAVAATLAPAAFMREPLSPVIMPTLYAWGGGSGRDSIENKALVAEMERLWKECVNYSAPSLIRVDKRTYQMVRKYRPELFA